mgnify:CR=1 FL=1
MGQQSSNAQNIPTSNVIQRAIGLAANFTPSWDLFTQYSSILDDEIGELTQRQVSKSSIKITITDEAPDSLLGRLLQSAGVKSKYAYATAVNVKIGGSIGFKQRIDDLLFALEHLPMLTQVKFTLTGAFLGGQQKELEAMLGEYKPHYSYEFDSSLLEDKILEEYELIKKIRKVTDG